MNELFEVNKLLHNSSINTTFDADQKRTSLFLKSSELHRLIKRNGWVLLRAEGSHYIYRKGEKTYPVPFHGSKEVGKGLEKKIKKEMGLK